MRNAGIGRRSVLCGLVGMGAGLALPSAHAEQSSLIAHGALANNTLAQAFEKAPSASLPDVTLVGLQGEITLDSLKGRTILMPLWAEWCAPCLSEIPDFAKLEKKYGNARFAVVPVLSGTQKQMTPPWIAHLFTILHAEALPAVAEKNFGGRLIRTMGREGGRYSLPCNLLIAPDGRVVGREMGRISAPDASEGAAPAKTKDPETVTRAINGQSQSMWGKPEGEDFARAMANGFLG
jgi:thiol-disulfide isomerase/thioredoxin